MKFNDIKLDKELSKLHESLAELRLEEGISSKASVNTNTEATMHTQHMDGLKKEAREPTG